MISINCSLTIVNIRQKTHIRELDVSLEQAARRGHPTLHGVVFAILCPGALPRKVRYGPQLPRHGVDDAFAGPLGDRFL